MKTKKELAILLSYKHDPRLRYIFPNESQLHRELILMERGITKFTAMTNGTEWALVEHANAKPLEKEGTWKIVGKVKSDGLIKRN